MAFVAALLGFAFMGTMLGLLGAGGSILSVPLLIYVLGMQPTVATSYSLVIVAFCAVVALIPYWRERLVDYRVVVVFAPLTVAGVWLARQVFLPAIPKDIYIGSQSLSKEIVILVVFAIVMLRAAWVMLRPARKEQAVRKRHRFLAFIVTGFRGLLIGSLTGFIGAGGGFMIVPALHSWFKLPMDRAVGTSLVVIATNASLGALFSRSYFEADVWWHLSGLLLAAVAGIYVGGTLLRKRINPVHLRPVFGWLVVAIAAYILVDGILKIIRTASS